MNSVARLLRNLWITFRPHFFFVSGSAGLIGMTMMYQDPPLWKTVTVFLVCFFSYGLIQALCDTFDLETDRINAPFRPMVTGELPVRTVVIILTSLLIVVGVLFFIINPLLLIVEGVALLFSLTYNRMKKIPNLGPLWNGVIVATLPLIGALGVSESRSFAGVPATVYAVCGIVGLVYAGFVLTGYFKDVTGDAQTGYRTAPVVYGIERAKWQVLPYVAVACAGIIAAPLFGLPSWTSASTTIQAFFLVAGLGSLMFLARSTILLIRNPGERHSYLALLWYTRGMVLFFLSLVVLFSWIVAAVAITLFMPAMEYFLAETASTGQA